MIATSRKLLSSFLATKTFCALLIAFEIILCIAIIKKVAYTEIDWIAYMQEVKGYLDGERNYLNLYGDTGPLVYPAGFLYVFSGLRWLTKEGTDILTGQYMFAGLYILTLCTVFALYRIGSKEAVIPHYVMILLLLSKRIHSIFVLRMFNDCVAVACGYIAILLFTKYQWRRGCLVYSFGVSIKMNMLLYAPGILLVLLIATTLQETIICLSICALLQLLLGFPFLITFPKEYLTRSFELNRVFMYKWTVNFKFLSEEIFLKKYLSILLLVLTISGMIVLYHKIISENYNLLTDEKSLKKKTEIKEKTSKKNLAFTEIFGKKRDISGHFIITTIFMSNFIGIAFARTLHYQFYVWYFHTIPYLLWHTGSLPLLVKIFVFFSIEVAFNIYPATWWSSALLQVAHIILLIGLYTSSAPKIFLSPQDIETVDKKEI